MEAVLLAVVLLFALLFLVFLVARSASTFGQENSYRLREFLSRGEIAFLLVFQSSLPDGFSVVVKPRMADLLQPVPGSPRKVWQSAFNRIASKHVDFAVLNQSTMQIVGIVELDDSSHLSAKAKAADKFKDAAFASAGLPLLRIRAAKSYALADLRHSVTQKIFSVREEKV